MKIFVGNVVLDTVTYQGHTTSFDGLWGGVPLVTLGTGKDLAARVGISTLTVLNLTELIAMVGRPQSLFLHGY